MIYKPHRVSDIFSFGEHTGQRIMDVHAKDPEYLANEIIKDNGFYIVDEWHLHFDILIVYVRYYGEKFIWDNKNSLKYGEWKLFSNVNKPLLPLLVHRPFDFNLHVIALNYAKFKAHQEQKFGGSNIEEDILANKQNDECWDLIKEIVENNSYSTHINSMRAFNQSREEDEKYFENDVLNETSDYNDNLDMDQQSQSYLQSFDENETPEL